MTLLYMDQYIDMFIHQLKVKKKIRGVNNITYDIKRSKKSQSLYLCLCLPICNTNYKRTIRISDHFLENTSTQSPHFKGVLISKDKTISSHKLRKLESFISSQIKKLLIEAPMHAILNFSTVKTGNSPPKQLHNRHAA